MIIKDFIKALSSKEPIPGGGGASALLGTVGVSLCLMSANIASGKEEFADHQKEINFIQIRTNEAVKNLYTLIKKDEEAFEPLSKVYKLPKDTENREQIIEEALINACSTLLEIIFEVYKIIDIIESLSKKCPRLVLSDVGVGAAACRSAVEGAAINIYANTKLMKNREFACKTESEVDRVLDEVKTRCDKVYESIKDKIKNK